MTVVGIFLGLLMLVLIWLLWTPIRLEIDSENSHFQLEWRHIARVRWLPEQALDCLFIKALFWERQLYLTNHPVKRTQTVSAPKVKKAPPVKKPLPLKTIWRLTRHLLQSFEVKRFQVQWDSDDFIWNARVFPLAWFLSTRWNARVQINFMGRRELALVLENRPGRMLWAVLQTFFTKR